MQKHSRTKLAWFSGLIQYSARKQGGLILQCSRAHTGQTKDWSMRFQWSAVNWSAKSVHCDSLLGYVDCGKSSSDRRWRWHCSGLTAPVCQLGLSRQPFIKWIDWTYTAICGRNYITTASHKLPLFHSIAFDQRSHCASGTISTGIGNSMWPVNHLGM